MAGILLPSPGGLLDQSAWLMAAFDILADEDSRIPKDKANG
tara:strand:+ start:306 stop:428 length:123 start_codon:yes stop_codon:yes gene_type:complete